MKNGYAARHAEGFKYMDTTIRNVCSVHCGRKQSMNIWQLSNYHYWEDTYADFSVSSLSATAILLAERHGKNLSTKSHMRSAKALPA
mmetsp:Transcript_9504/g.15552  ORF Transcript_9504/g.15552 Transcript_9504/m.15552 type:complete len:87 (-) Transcript_9504:415-675(-)